MTTRKAIPLALISFCALSTHALGATVYTPNGTAVTVVADPEGLSVPEIAAWNNHVALTYPNAINIGSATSRRNCHSYAWHSQSSTNYYWMNGTSMFGNQEDKYWTDGSYVRTTPSRTPHIYGRISYAGDHSGYIADTAQNTPKFVRSKWGVGPTMAHAPNYAAQVYPQDYGNPTAYYTRANVCPFGTGNYCGDPLRVNQNANYLYSCAGAGVFSLKSTCNNKGCKLNGNGLNDVCKP